MTQSNVSKAISFVLLGLLILELTGCKTRSEIRREQEMEKIKQEVTVAKGQRADVETTVDELRTEVARLAVLLEEQSSQLRQHDEELKKDMGTLTTRIQAIEQRAVEDELAQKRYSDEQKKIAEERSRASFETGKTLYDQDKYEDAAEVFRAVMKNKAGSADARKAQFFLGESLFSQREYASATGVFTDFIKAHPKDTNVPTAMLRQAQAFKLVGKPKEAKIFFQDVVEKFPKSAAAGKAKAELKKLK